MARLLFHGSGSSFLFEARQPGFYVEVTDAARGWYVVRVRERELREQIPRLGAGVYDLYPTADDLPTVHGRFEYKIITESQPLDISILLYPHLRSGVKDFVWMAAVYMPPENTLIRLELPEFVYPEPAVPAPLPDPPERFEREEVI